MKCNISYKEVDDVFRKIWDKKPSITLDKTFPIDWESSPRKEIKESERKIASVKIYLLIGESYEKKLDRWTFPAHFMLKDKKQYRLDKGVVKAFIVDGFITRSDERDQTYFTLTTKGQNAFHR